MYPTNVLFGTSDQGQMLDVWGGIQPMSTLRWWWWKSHHLSAEDILNITRYSRRSLCRYIRSYVLDLRMDPVQRSLCTLTPVQYVTSFWAGKVCHLSIVSIAYGVVKDSTQYTPFLTHWLRASARQWLSLRLYWEGDYLFMSSLLKFHLETFDCKPSTWRF